MHSNLMRMPMVLSDTLAFVIKPRCVRMIQKIARIPLRDRVVDSQMICSRVELEVRWNSSSREVAELSN